MTTVAIHQPEYFPWLGYFDKIRRADIFVLLDNVQFDRSSMQQRTRVAGAGGTSWMSIPFIHKFPQQIDEVVLAEDRWRSKHGKTVQACYGRAPGYKRLAPQLDHFFNQSFTHLAEVTIGSVELLMEAFGVRPNTQLLRASRLPVTGSKGDLVLAICQHLKATRYLSGHTGATYLDHEQFAAAGVQIEVQSYQPPIYPRSRPLTEEESYGLSALDACLHLGENAPALFANIGNPS